MKFNPDTHHRRSIRLPDYDYSQAGAYFVTICVWQRECLLGDIINGEMQVNEMGRIVEDYWNAITRHFPYVTVDECAIMPNHLHGVIFITDFVGAKQGLSASPCVGVDAGLKKGEAGETFASPLQGDRNGTTTGSLGAIIQNFKSVSTRKINKLRQNPGCPLWQRNYYERVIRNENELARAREYIVNNPLKWELDRENPVNMV